MLQRILQWSIAQRFLVVVATLLLVGIGVVSWNSLTLDAVPDITPNQVQINTRTPGMAPAEVEKLVTFPIETTLGGVPGVTQVRSLSQYGLSQVTVTFKEDVDIYFARQLVNERLQTVREQLPPAVNAPAMGPVSTGLGEVFQFVVESDTQTPMELRTLMDWTIRPRLRTVPGVAEVNSQGGYEKQYEIRIDPQRMRSRGVSLAQVIEAAQKNNQNAGGGFIERKGEQTIVRSIGMATGADDIGNIVVEAEHGTPILLRDVADIVIGTPLRTGVATKDGREVVLGVVMMLKGANGRTVALAAEERLKAIQEQLPPNVLLSPVYNRSELVGHAVETVEWSLLEGGILVVVILLALLGNWRGAVIVALAIPLSMLFAVTLMNRFGVSGNLMSLGAIDFGLIVDGAVVMVEHAVAELSHRREKVGRTLTRAEVREQVYRSSAQVATPVAFAVTIITVVYLPILTLEGTEGKMFRPMALTVVFALVGALMLTMTLIPTLCAMFLSGDTREGKNPVMAFFSAVYRPVLSWSLRSRFAVAAGAVGILVLAGVLASRLGTEFIPQLDEGDVLVQPVRLRTVGEKETLKLVEEAERVLKAIPEVTTVFSRSGTGEVATDPMPMSLTDTYVMLKPRNQWRKGVTKVKLIEEIEEKLKVVPGQGYGFTQPIQMRFDELTSGVKANIGIKVFGEDLDELNKQAARIAAVLKMVPGAADVTSPALDSIPVLQITMDRNTLARVGVNISDAQEWVATALAGRSVGQIIEGDKRFDMTVRLPESDRTDVNALRALPITTPGGGAVRLDSVATIQMTGAPPQVTREQGKRFAVVLANVRGRDLGGFVNEARARIKRDVKLPTGYYVEWSGQFENLQRAAARLALVVPLALGLIFALLFLSFGDLKQSLLIFTGVPLAVTGGVFGLVSRGLPLSISAGIGFIALSGVAVLNGVVMVSAINALRAEGRTVKDAVWEGANARLRPVLMTALVAAIGFMPMALNTGIGAEVQRPLATVVIGGIVSSTILTLVVLPMLYASFMKDESQEVDGRQPHSV